MSPVSVLCAAVVPAALALFCACTSVSRAAFQDGLASVAPSAMPAIQWIKRTALPDNNRGCARYATGIAAKMTAPYGLGATSVVLEGPFLMPRWQVGAFHADSNPNRWHSVKHDEFNPAPGQHVLFVWPEI